jgi:hypothetical protein
MLQPLTHYLQVPIITEMVQSHGPYLEKLTKDEKYCLIGCLALWQQRIAEDLYTEPIGYELQNVLESLLEDYPTGPVVETLLREYLLKLNEPQVLRLLPLVVAQLREGYYRRRDYGEYDQLGGPQGDPFCDLPSEDPNKKFEMLDSEDLDEDVDFDQSDVN